MNDTKYRLSDYGMLVITNQSVFSMPRTVASVKFSIKIKQ